MTEAETAWVAGLFEGEGCILSGRRGSSWRPFLRIGMTDRDVIDRVRDLLGGNVYTCPRPPYKTMYVWELGVVASAEVMPKLYPLLGRRRRARWDELIALWKEKRRPEWNEPVASFPSEKVAELMSLARAG